MRFKSRYRKDGPQESEFEEEEIYKADIALNKKEGDYWIANMERQQKINGEGQIKVVAKDFCIFFSLQPPIGVNQSTYANPVSYAQRNDIFRQNMLDTWFTYKQIYKEKFKNEGPACTT